LEQQRHTVSLGMMQSVPTDELYPDLHAGYSTCMAMQNTKLPSEAGTTTLCSNYAHVWEVPEQQKHLNILSSQNPQAYQQHHQLDIVDSHQHHHVHTPVRTPEDYVAGTGETINCAGYHEQPLTSFEKSSFTGSGVDSSCAFL